MAADPSVSPADTIRRAENGLAELRAAVADDTMPCLFTDDARGLLEAWDALLAVGERDKAEIERLRQGLWDCAIRTGMDSDGDETPASLAHPDIVDLALREVERLRADYDAAGERDRRQIARLTERCDGLEDVARAALTWAPGNAKIELAARLAAVLAGEEDAPLSVTNEPPGASS